jgi:hypothetical protein
MVDTLTTGNTMTLIGALLNFLISLAANGVTSVALMAKQKNLDEALADEQSLRKALISQRPLREEVQLACFELARNRDRLGVNREEEPLWLLLSDDFFQNDLVEWLMAGGIEEGKAVKARLVETMASALSRSGAPPERIEFLNTQYFEALDRAVFSNPVLAAWRHQLSLDYLREQVAFLRRMAEEAAGVYSSQRRQAALESYCEKALKAWDIIDLSNLPEGDIHIATQKLLLRQLYMPLRLSIQVSREEGRDKAAFFRLEESREAGRRWEAGRAQRGEPPSAEAAERSTVGERLGVARRLVILGDPGGGKTTMARWMATVYLLRYRGDLTWRQIPDAVTLPDKHWIPVLIRCRELGEADLCRCFRDFLSQHLQKSELLPEEADVMRAVILESVAKGEALLLVDGLDEITSPKVRMMFCQELERCAVRYPDAPMLVTSRIVGYRDMPYRMGAGFEHDVIAELTRPDKDLFAKRWIEVTEQHQPTAEKAKRLQDLVDALHSSDRIERLTGNPMLLTTLALVKRKVGKLPNRRTKLYAEAVSVLLNWNPRYYETIDELEAIPQLEYLAYEMCRQGVQRLTEDDVLDLLERVRQEYRNIRPIGNRTPDVFLALLEARSSILIRSGGQWIRQQGEEKRVWEFRHLTFQEYLAARALFDGRYPGRDRQKKTLAEQVAPLAGSVKETRHVRRPEVEFEVSESWQEALRLLVADCRDDDVDDVLRAIATPLPHEDGAKTARPRAILAARCLVDEPNASEEVVEDVLEMLAGQVSGSDGWGRELTVLDAAAIELASCHWTLLLERQLFGEYCRRVPGTRWNVGGVWGEIRAAGAPRNKAELHSWASRLPEELRSGDEFRACGAALAIMIAAFEGNLALVPGLADGLLELLHGSPPVCYAAAWALGWLSRSPGEDKTRSPLWQPRGGEVTSLIAAFEGTAAEEVDTRRWLASALGMSADPRALGLLLGELEHPDIRLRWTAVRALGELADQRAVAGLARSIHDSDDSVRVAVAETLAKLGGDQAISALADMCGDPKAEVRREVVLALAALGGERVIDPLIRMVDDPGADVRRAVVEAVGRLYGGKAAAALRGRLEDPVTDIRASAAAALAHFEDAPGAAVLAQLLRHGRTEVRMLAVEAYADRQEEVARRLLSRDCDATAPWLDPQNPITETRVTKASRRLGISAEEVRTRYEALANDLGLKLSWKEPDAAAESSDSSSA